MLLGISNRLANEYGNESTLKTNVPEDGSATVAFAVNLDSADLSLSDQEAIRPYRDSGVHFDLPPVGGTLGRRTLAILSGLGGFDSSTITYRKRIVE